jgi:hypothetical protein
MAASHLGQHVRFEIPVPNRLFLVEKRYAVTKEAPHRPFLWDASVDEPYFVGLIDPSLHRSHGGVEDGYVI